MFVDKKVDIRRKNASCVENTYTNSFVYFCTENIHINLNFSMYFPRAICVSPSKYQLCYRFFPPM